MLARCRRPALHGRPVAGAYDRAINYELFMGEALAEARMALARGERPVAAVAVVDEAMVARAQDRVQETNDPTAHAVVVALREAARKLGTTRLADRQDAMIGFAECVLASRQAAETYGCVATIGKVQVQQDGKWRCTWDDADFLSGSVFETALVTSLPAVPHTAPVVGADRGR